MIKPMPANSDSTMTDSAPQFPRWVGAVILTCCLVEGLLMLAGLLGWDQARNEAVLYGAFWSVLMSEGIGVFPGQGATMFVSYGFLHAGLLHLGMNMISLAAVARELWRLMPGRLMALAYAASQIAGAAVYGWMQPEGGPMVGASGAVFGLAGALLGYGGIWRFRSGRSMRPVWRAVAMVLGLNVALTLLMPQIAWQAHLGGAAAGMAVGLIAAGLRGAGRRAR